MADLIRLVLLILLLPIILILIGPLLILAALRGRQPVGPITLETSRYGVTGRSGVFLLGLAIWILVWSGLAWLVLTAFVPPVAIVSVPLSPTATATPVNERLTPSPPPAPATPTGLPTSIPLMETPPEPPTPPNRSTPSPTSTSTSTPTITPVPPTATPSPSPSATSTSTPTPTLTSTSTPTATPTPTFTATPLPSPTATPEPETVVASTPTVSATTPPSPTATAVQTGATASPVPTATSQSGLSFSERQAVVEVVEEGNLLLREAITLANEENLQAMETVWQGLALNVARNFATELYDKYAKPIQVKFEYLKPPAIDPDSSQDEVIVTSRERWTYGGPTQFDREEAFQFIYTLEQEDGQWMITRYTYRNLPVSSPTPAP